MHLVVDIVPLIIHASLFIFLAGLVVFLIPVNIIVMVASSVLLATLVAVYSTLTILPIIHADCPYRTPLSNNLWCIVQWIRSPQIPDTKKSSSPPTTMTDVMTREATALNTERIMRDRRALGWTITSLTDDNALQPFVQCIPEVMSIQGVNGSPNLYPLYFKLLIDDKNVRLALRIEGMLRSCGVGHLTENAKDERQAVCYKSMWFLHQIHSTLSVIQDQTLIETAYAPTSIYSLEDLLPLVTVSRYRTYISIDPEILATIHNLNACLTHGLLPDFASVIGLITKLKAANFDYPDMDAIDELLQNHGPAMLASVATRAWITRAVTLMQALRIDSPYLLLFRYLGRAAQFDSLPLWHSFTRAAFDHIPSGIPSSTLKIQYGNIFSSTVNRWAISNWNHVNEILFELADFWRVIHPRNTVPQSILTYFNAAVTKLGTTFTPRPVSDHVALMIEKLGRESLWTGVSADISVTEGLEVNHILVTGTTSLCVFELRAASESVDILATTIYESALSIITHSPWSQLFAPAIAMVKIVILTSSLRLANQFQDKIPDLAALTNSGILPAETASPTLDDLHIDSTKFSELRENLENRVGEASINILAELLESYSRRIPDRASQFISEIGRALWIPAPGAVHPNHQLRLVNILQTLFTSDEGGTGEGESVEKAPTWLDHPAAADIIASWAVADVEDSYEEVETEGSGQAG